MLWGKYSEMDFVDTVCAGDVPAAVPPVPDTTPTQPTTSVVEVDPLHFPCVVAVGGHPQEDKPEFLLCPTCHSDRCGGCD